jgi:dihydrofolate synthase / folylpolyglutamate synthase
MRLASRQTIEEEYSETYDFLCSLERFGILLGLENITRLLDSIGNPQKSFPVVHVAGSNGKGSTASFIASALIEAGYKTALYTSPHLNDFRERIRIDGAMVSMEEVVLSTRKIREVYDPEHTTFFEFTTAVAFDIMARAKPDIGVIEVGLGGRLDATNTVNPLVTVITDISREHEDYLGEGIESVAREKAGIIKNGVPLVTGATRAEARKVILGTARAGNAPVREFGKDFMGKRTALDAFTYSSRDLTLETLYLGMAGGHQIKNGSLACAVLEELRTIGYRISDRAITEGLRKTSFPGRFELVRSGPDTIIDGAHTPESMRLLKSTLKRHYPGVRPFMLLGMLKEKNYEEMIGILVPMAREVVCVRPQGDRAMDPEDLADHVKRYGIPAQVSEDIVMGLRMLEERASENDVILAAGSLYMIGPVRRACGLKDA